MPLIHQRYKHLFRLFQYQYCLSFLVLKQVECGVCHDVFSAQGEKVPRLLLCGHTVCHQCLTRLPVDNYFILCPFDRQPTQLGPSGIWGLNKNYALVELLDKLYTGGSLGLAWNQSILDKEKEHCIKCDENEEHTAVLYCITCSTHLCLECSESTHNTRTLLKHQRIPISEKPKEYPKCVYHPMHLVEFACLEEECKFSPLMCYICKDYGRHLKHKHTLLETEAENVRTCIINAVQHYRKYSEEVSERARRLVGVIQQVEGNVQYTLDGEGVSRTLHNQGTGEAARHKVQQYFSELHERLKGQEVAALNVVDTHVRERLCMLKQHQEDMSTLLAQIASVCYQCEKTLQQDDSKILMAKGEVTSMLENVKKQQQHFVEVLDHHQLDPTIPITFTKDNRVHIGPKMEMRVVTLGLDDSGKTSILFQLKQNEFITTIPTIGFNVETVEYRNLKFTIWDVGGQPKLRPLWKHYYFNTQALIFVVDSVNKERLNEAHEELTKLMQEKELKDASLLILANKQDLEGCSTIEELTERFHLFKLCCNRSWHIQACDAQTGSGLFDGLNWLSHQLVSARVS